MTVQYRKIFLKNWEEQSRSRGLRGGTMIASGEKFLAQRQAIAVYKAMA